MNVTQTVETTTAVIISFFFINCFFNKGTKWVCELDYADNCQKTQTVVFPIQPNRDPKQVQQKFKSSVCPVTIGQHYKRKIIKLYRNQK